MHLWSYAAATCKSGIRCEIGGRHLSNGQTIYIRNNNHGSIVKCSAPKCQYSYFIPEDGLPKRSIYDGTNDDEHILGIRLEAFVNNTEIRLHGFVGVNTDTLFTLRLEFVGEWK